MQYNSNLSFGLLSDINYKLPETYEDKIFLTFDIDWAHDTVIEDTINILKTNNTKQHSLLHETKVIDQIRDDLNFELGIHPNFNPLLDGNSHSHKDSSEVIRNILKIVPGARCVRSHSMSQNFHLLDLFSKFGLTHDSNDFIPEQSGPSCTLYTLDWTIKNSIFWEDNIKCLYKENSKIEHLIYRKV